MFEGFVPPEYSALTTLEKINLSRNRLEGGLSFLLNNKDLVSLVLSNNVFHERLPEDLGQLNKLDVLYLQHNKFDGEFYLSRCTGFSSLRLLNLAHNNLGGAIPEEIGMMKKLVSLILEGNKFKAPLPKSLSELVNLKDFSVFKNFPAETTQLPRGFNRRKFERIHVFGPKIGLDNVHFNETSLYGADPDQLLPLARKLQLFPSHKF